MQVFWDVGLLGPDLDYIDKRLVVALTSVSARHFPYVCATNAPDDCRLLHKAHVPFRGP